MAEGKLSRQQGMILKALREAGGAGARNTQLNTLCFRYGARIWELGKKGYRIECRPVDAAHGLYKYVLVEEPVRSVSDPVPAPPGRPGAEGLAACTVPNELFTVTNGPYGQEIKPS